MGHPRPNAVSRRQIATIAAASMLGRCAAVPDIGGLTAKEVGLSDRHAGAPPRRSSADSVDALQQQYDLQNALSSEPMIFGNKITLLTSATDALRAIFAAIAAARDSVDLEYFVFSDVVSDGRHLSDLLLDRLWSDVKVNIIYDSFGSQDTPQAFFDDLRRAGAKILEFHPIDPLAETKTWSPNDRDHRKITIVDGRIGFAGGVNLDKVYENPRSAGVPADGDTRYAFWRDSAIRIDGPAVAALQKLFFKTWQAENAPPVEAADYFPTLPRQGVQTIRILGSAPHADEPLYYASLLTAIRGARKRVWLCSGYFIPPHQERENLVKAAKAGLDVRIVVPAFSDVQSAVFASRAAYGDLLEAGAHIFEIRDSVLHAKMAVVDDTWTMVGSSNLDRRSVVFNNEVDAVILGHDAAGQVEALLRQLMGIASEVGLKQWEGRSVNERLLELRARIWEYWM